MNYLTGCKPLAEILPLLGLTYTSSAQPVWIPFAPVRYLGIQ